MSQSQKQSAGNSNLSNLNQLKNAKRLYIYAQIDIDKAYNQIVPKSKKIQKFIETNSLDFQFTQKMRHYKNFRITFDNELQKYIHNKQLAPDFRLIKKNVFTSLQDFIISRYQIYIDDENLHREYKAKIEEVEAKFAKRLEELMRDIDY